MTLMSGYSSILKTNTILNATFKSNNLDMVALVQLLIIYLNVIYTVQSATITVYELRRRCPNTEEKWRERVDGYICRSPTQYHCMLTGDGGIVEFCSDIIWIENDYCPVFNSKTGSIDVQLCPENGDCPRKQYLSNTVYKYPDCLQDYRPLTTSNSKGSRFSLTETKGSMEEPSYSNSMIAMAALRLTSISMVFVAINSLLFTTIFIVLVVLIYIRTRKDKVDVSKPKGEEDGSTEAGETHSSCSSWGQNPIRVMVFKFFRCEKLKSKT